MSQDIADLNHDGITSPSVDTEPSGAGAQPTTQPGGGDWNLVHRLDVLCAIYKNLAEGYGARPGHSVASTEALEHLEAVIAGMVKQLPLPAAVPVPTPTMEELGDDHDITGPDNEDN
jgi:hypothetical protein